MDTNNTRPAYYTGPWPITAEQEAHANAVARALGRTGPSFFTSPAGIAYVATHGPVDPVALFYQTLREEEACLQEEEAWNADEARRVAADMCRYGGTPVTDQTCREFVAAQSRMYP